ncbi:MAG: VOC family protein [Anaerolineae bacterium]|nr:VOC family protein [Anaerolineae bacterium]
MTVQPIPEGYHTVTPYLIVSGVPQLIDFVKEAFGAEELVRMAQGDGTIGHAEVKIGTSRVMMGEASGNFKPMPTMLHLYVEDTDAFYQSALQAGATSIMEPVDQFYGDRMGAVQDAFGNQWWIATHVEDVPPEEIAKRASQQF